MDMELIHGKMEISIKVTSMMDQGKDRALCFSKLEQFLKELSKTISLKVKAKRNTQMAAISRDNSDRVKKYQEKNTRNQERNSLPSSSDNIIFVEINVSI